MAHVSQASIGVLIRKLDTSKDSVAEKIIRKLVTVGKPAVSPLMAAARDLSEPRIRKWSLEALGEIADAKAGGLLIQALGDERMTVRLHAVKGLGRMRLKKAASAVARLIGDPSGGVRVNALDTLAAIGAKSQAKAVLSALGDEKWYVRQHACIACGRLGLRQAAPRLKKMTVADSRKAVRDAAARTLAGLSDPSGEL